MADLPEDQDEADALSRRVYSEGAAESLGDAHEAEAVLEQTYKRASSDVQALVRARGDGVTRRKVANDVERVLSDNVFERAKTIGVSIRKSSARGVVSARKTMTAVYGDQQTKAQVRASTKALREGGERIAGRTTVDGAGLVKRIRRHDAKAVQDIAREVDQVFRAGGGVLDAADRIVRIDGAVPVELAQYEQELVSYVRKLDGLTGSAAKAAKSELKKAVARHMRVVNRLGELQADGTRKASAYSLRGPGKRFASQIVKARGQDVDRVIAKHIEEKAMYRARVIARHETNQAYEKAYVEQQRTKPGVVCFQLTLSSAHRVPDMCDAMCAANNFGLGPGCYPVDQVPDRHALCRCVCSSRVDAQHFSRPEGSPRVPDEFRDKTSPAALAWYRANPGPAAAILGPTRHGMLQAGRSDVIDAVGKPVPVGELLGLRRAAE